MRAIFACMMLPALLAAADPDELRLRTSLAGGPIRGVVPDGHADFKLRPSRGSLAFSVEVEDVQLPVGTRLDILVNGVFVGQMSVSGPPAMGAELELNSQDGAQVPTLKAGDVVEVRAGAAVLLSGVLQTTPLIDSLRNSPPRSTVSSTPSNGASSIPQPSGQEPARLRTPLTGGALAGQQPSGHVDFRADSARGTTRLSVEVEDVNLPAGTVLQLEVEGRVVTSFRLGAGGFAELELDSRNGDLVNQIRAGAGVRILSPNGPILSGGMQLVTPSSANNSAANNSYSASQSGGASTTGNGETRVRTPLAGGAVSGLQPSGKADFRVRGSDSRLNVEIEDINLPAGTVVDVFVGNQRIGAITVGPPPIRGGELELNSKDGALVPTIRPGDQITIRTSAQGVLVTGVVQAFSFSEVPPVPPAVSSNSSSNSGGSNSNPNQAGDDKGGSSGGSNSNHNEPGDDHGGNSGSSNSGSGSSNSGSSNSGSGSSNSGSGSSNSGSGSSNSGSGSSNSGSGSSNSGSGSSNSGSSNSGSGSSNSGSSNSGSNSGGSNSGGSNSGGSNSGGSGKGGGADDPPGHN